MRYELLDDADQAYRTRVITSPERGNSMQWVCVNVPRLTHGNRQGPRRCDPSRRWAVKSTRRPPSEAMGR